MFASVPDPDYPGHVILEQFQAQVTEQANLLFPEVLSFVSNVICYFFPSLYNVVLLTGWCSIAASICI